jgi:signal peptidase II
VSKRQIMIPRFAPLVVAALVVFFDRATKDAVQRSVGFLDAIPVIPGWLRIIHTENAGAAFGMFAEGTHPFLRSALLIGVSAIVLLYVASALWHRGSAYASLRTRLALSLILGGACGNLYDRVVHGTVTDFIEVYHGGWSFPAFNVADSAITVGAALLLLDLLYPQRKRMEEGAGLAPK